MSDVPVIIPVETAEQNDKIETVDENKTDKNSIINKTHDDKPKPHNGKPIIKIEVSTNGKFLVTYSKEDHSIVGWNIEEGQPKPGIPVKTNDKTTKEYSWTNGTDMDEGQLKSDITIKLNDEHKHLKLNQICVSD